MRSATCGGSRSGLLGGAGEVRGPAWAPVAAVPRSDSDEMPLIIPS